MRSAAYHNLSRSRITVAFTRSPHLSGHVTIMLPYNMVMFGEDPSVAQEHRAYYAKEESVRLSAGLEDKQDLLDTLQHALDEAIKVKRGNGLRHEK